MAIVNDYIGWPVGVNKILYDSTNISMGEGATRSDELESGLKRTHQKGSFVPDKYSAKMYFNYVDIVPGTNKTEFQLFTEWYKYKHKYGQIPFEFPEILYSQNTGIMVADEAAHNYAVEYYKITNAVNGAKSGLEIEVTMTWESVYGGTISIPTATPQVATFSAHYSYADVIFSSVSDTAPVSQMFTLFIDDVQTPLTGFYYDGDKTVRLYYEERAHGTATFSLNNYAGYSVPSGLYTSAF